MTASRSEIVALARSWIGTPYHHQASSKQVGADCLGLVRGVFRELFGHEPEVLPAYSPDWAEARGEETMISGARRHLIETAAEHAAPGDVLIFRYRHGLIAKHAAIMTEPSKMVHAVEGAPVSEVHIVPWWRRRIAGVFVFPGVV